MKLAAYLTVLSVCVFSPTFADEPQTPASQPVAQAAVTQATPPNAQATPPGAQAAPAPGATPAPAAAAQGAATVAKVDKSEIVDKAATDAQIKQMRARGYKPVNRNGILVYCRSEGQIGTHFEKQRCNTMDELKNAELTGKEYVNSIQQQGSSTIFLKDPGPGH
jgi:hypothetical protein